MASSDSSSERLLNLVIALLNTPSAMTKEHIRRTVAGYDVPAHDDAFFRMLERDKAVLRTLGVPIVTVGTEGHVSEIGYRIDPASYELDGLQFTGTQLAVLGMAAELWRGQALRSDMNRALTKLRAVGEDSDGAVTLLSGELVPSVTPPRPSHAEDYDVIVDAISARRRVQFTYRSASQGIAAKRKVEPWRIAVRPGGWYLVGRDIDRGAARVFHLARIESSVRAAGPDHSFEMPPAPSIDAALSSVTPSTTRTATLAIASGRGGALRSRGVSRPGGEDGRDWIDVRYWSSGQLATEIAGYGESVLVVSPEGLRGLVIDRLRSAASIEYQPPGPTHHGPTVEGTSTVMAGGDDE